MATESVATELNSIACSIDGLSQIIGDLANRADAARTDRVCWVVGDMLDRLNKQIGELALDVQELEDVSSVAALPRALASVLELSAEDCAVVTGLVRGGLGCVIEPAEVRSSTAEQLRTLWNGNATEARRQWSHDHSDGSAPQ